MRRRLAPLSLALFGLLLASPDPAAASRSATAQRPAKSKSKKVSRTGPGANRPAGKLAIDGAVGLTPVTRKRVVVGPRTNPIDRLPPGPDGRIIFGVMGGAGSDTPRRVQQASFALGTEIASGGDVILTGACPGLPDDAVRGARSRGGVAVGISPFSTMKAHRADGAPVDFDVLQLTSLPAAQAGEDRPNFMGREIDNIVRSDAIVILGGRTGTLGELAIAFEERRPIGVLTGSGGMADLVREIVKTTTRAGKPPGAPVIYDSDPVRLVRRLARVTRGFRAAGVKGPLGDGDKHKTIAPSP